MCTDWGRGRLGCRNGVKNKTWTPRVQMVIENKDDVRKMNSNVVEKRERRRD
jgi:hypothetical protein